MSEPASGLVAVLAACRSTSHDNRDNDNDNDEKERSGARKKRSWRTQHAQVNNQSWDLTHDDDTEEAQIKAGRRGDEVNPQSRSAVRAYLCTGPGDSSVVTMDGGRSLPRFLS